MTAGRNTSGKHNAVRPHCAPRWSGLRVRAGSALAALLCNAIILAALRHDFDWIGQTGGNRTIEEMKSFALPAPELHQPPDPPRRERRPISTLSPARPSAMTPARPAAAPAPAPISVPAVESVRTAAPNPPSAPAESALRAEDRQTDAAWDAYQAKIWARIAARRPQGIHLPGEVLIAFTLDTDGRLVSAGILRSGGNAQLDRLALRTLTDSSPFPPPPPAVRDRPLRFTIRFGFR